MPALAAVEVEPFVVVEPPRRGLPSGGMEGYQVARVDAAYAARHGPYYCLLAPVVGIAVAAEDPYHVGILVAFGYETPVRFGVAFVEYYLSLVPIPSPCGQQTDVHAEFVGAAYDVVDMVPIVVLRALLHCGACGVAVGERQVAVGVADIHAVELGQGHGLYDVEPFGGAVAQVVVGLLAVETVEELPCRVALIEEGPAVGILQVVSVLGDGDGPLLRRGGRKERGGRRGACKQKMCAFHGLSFEQLRLSFRPLLSSAVWRCVSCVGGLVFD